MSIDSDSDSSLNEFINSSQDSYYSSQESRYSSQDLEPFKPVSGWYGVEIPLSTQEETIASATPVIPGNALIFHRYIKNRENELVKPGKRKDEDFITNLQYNPETKKIHGKAVFKSIRSQDCYINYTIDGNENIIFIDTFECGEGYGKDLFIKLLKYLLIDKKIPIKILTLHAMPWIDISKIDPVDDISTQKKFDEYVLQMQKRLNQYYTEQLHLSRISANNNFKGNVSEIIANFDRKNESNFGCKSNKSFKFIEGSLVILKNNSDNKIYTVVGYEYETDKDVCKKIVVCKHITVNSADRPDIDDKEYKFNEDMLSLSLRAGSRRKTKQRQPKKTKRKTKLKKKTKRRFLRKTKKYKR